MKGIHERRRDLLIQMLAAGAFTLFGAGIAAPFARAGNVAAPPGSLSAGRSIYRLRGTVRVNGVQATPETIIRAADLVETGAGSEVVFAVGKDAFILRENSRLQLAADAGQPAEEASYAVIALRLATGALLSVFGGGARDVSTPIATIGVRGTGLYLESEPEQSYICTCYGRVDIAAAGDPASAETIVSTHHSAPRYVSAEGPAGRRISPAPMKNHDDEELLLIESLVGRAPPFAVPGRSPAQRRRY
jgi:hypothetical protein